jgi:undecaprenyl diphosphate synthase
LTAETLAGRLRPEDLDENQLSGALDTAGLPDPDFLIRTSGEMRISNFLLWQLAYTELYFTDTLWPDFNRGELHRALREYGQRQRRFGLTGAQVEDENPSPGEGHH